MSKYKKLLGDRVRYLRKMRGLSQEKLSESIGIDTNSISRIERGVHYPSLDTLEKIALKLKVEIRDLFLFNNKETAEEMRAYLMKTIAELQDEELREAVRAIRKIG